MATTPISPSAFNCSWSSSKGCSSSMSRDVNRLVHSGYGTGARPVLVGSADVGFSM
jgi:hypothetical protein